MFALSLHHVWLKLAAFGCGGALLAAVLLAWPLANWLQARELQLAYVGPGPDVLYLVGGADAQSARIETVVSFLAKQEPEQTPLLLVANDPKASRWSSPHQRNLTVVEWALIELERALRKAGVDVAAMPVVPAGGAAEADGGAREPAAGLRVEVVPGRYLGTDGEMEALANYLEERKAGRQAQGEMLAFATSPYHVRRVALRLRHYLGPRWQVRALPVEGRLSDRRPWLVLGELLKILRDKLHLSRVPLLSRAPMRGREEGFTTKARRARR